MGFVFSSNPFSSPNLLVPLVMFGWIPIVIYIFSRFPARRAIVISFIVAWLFLPQVILPIPGLPDYDKMAATCYAVVIATFIFDVGRFRSFRLSWIDLPILIWCLCPIASSLSNDLGLYDGMSAALGQTVTWGVPYFLGRIYLNSLSGMREMAIGIFMGGLAYVPLCLFEIRMSPQLHRIFYGGIASADFSQTIRLGGFRPTVFLIHGLAVGAFMMAATLVGIWLWQTGTVKRLWNIPIEWLVGALFITFILTRSTGAYGLLAIGIALLFVAKNLRTAVPLFLLIAGIAAYLYVNAGSGTYVADQLIDTLSQFLPEDRVQSLQFRFDNEEILSARAREKGLFGWGGFGRSLILKPDGTPQTIPDSLWIIAFGQNGAVGLVSLFVAMLLPTFSLFWMRYPARLWSNKKVAPAAAIALITVLYMVDCLVNAMINPIYILAAGGIAGLVLKRERVNKKTAQISAPERLIPSRRYMIQPR
jgi:hypothetical protein